MPHKNIEFKARVNNLELVENKLATLNPQLLGLDHQVDTYFNTSTGRLKLREGNIENALIYYNRENIAGSKLSQVILYKHTPDNSLKTILTTTLGIKVVVDKRRKIYFLANVKFHFDTVQELGTFIEVEAIDNDGSKSVEFLESQCNHYASFFGIQETDFISHSYSDLLLNMHKNM